MLRRATGNCEKLISILIVTILKKFLTIFLSLNKDELTEWANTYGRLSCNEAKISFIGFKICDGNVCSICGVLGSIQCPSVCDVDNVLDYVSTLFFNRRTRPLDKN